MHALNLITPGIILMMIIGLVAFIVVYRFIFKKK